MSILLTGALLIVLGIVLVGIWIAAKELAEFETAFNYGVLMMILLIVGAAVYLSFAAPSFATPEDTPTVNRVTEQESNLLVE